MKRSNTEQLNQVLYDVIHQASENCVVPSFDTVAERIRKGESAESFDRFFDVNSAEPRRWGKVFGAAAAAVLLAVSGVWVSRMMMGSRSFDTAGSSQSVYYEESAAQETYALDAVADSMTGTQAAEDWQEISDETDRENAKALEDIAGLSADDCTEAILSGGRKLLIPLDELSLKHDGAESSK